MCHYRVTVLIYIFKRECTRSSLCVYVSESSTWHTILENTDWDFRWKPIFIFLCPESICKVNPPRPDYDVLWRLISRTLLCIRTWNFVTTLLEVLKLSCYNLGRMYFITNLETMRFSASLKFRLFSAVFFPNFWLDRNSKL